MKDYSHATMADVGEIVRLIRSLRDLARKSHVMTSRTQSQILRTVPADVLCEVALQLDRNATPDPAVL